MKELNYIKSVFTENTGGGCMVDFIELDTGKIIALTDECVCVYNSIDEFYQCTDNSPLNAYFFEDTAK